MTVTEAAAAIGVPRPRVWRLADRLGLVHEWNNYSRADVAALFVAEECHIDGIEVDLFAAFFVMTFDDRHIPEAVGWIPGQGIAFAGTARQVGRELHSYAKRGIGSRALSLTPVLDAMAAVSG